MRVSFGTNTNAVRKRVRWYNRESSAEIIYEGQPVCYIFDSTNNELGYDAIAGAEQATTAEGNQNEGKFLQVEKPHDDNIPYFAGVVASGGWCGKSVAATSWEWIDIYIPNGAIVPVRCNIDTTVGRTILAIEEDVQHFSTLYAGASYNTRAVAIAMETETGLDDNAGITLAKLDPNMFINQDLGAGSSLIVAPSGTGGSALNRINVTDAYTAGSFCAFEIKTTHTGGAESSYGLAFMAKTKIQTIAPTARACAAGVRLSIEGGTHTEPLAALRVQLSESAGADVSGTSGYGYSVLNLVNQFAENPGAKMHHWMFLENDGSNPPDDFIYAKALADVPMSAHHTDSFSHSITINILGTLYYIMCTNDATNKS